MWVPRQERALPVCTAVHGYVLPDPGLAGRRRQRPFANVTFGKVQIDGSVIVRAGQQMQGISRRNSKTGFVLSLQERISVGPCSAGNHVYVLARLLSRRKSAKATDECEAEE